MQAEHAETLGLSQKGPLFLTGFMGAGKTTVGSVLADLLDCPFLDLDELIVRREGMSIAEIFSHRGEPYFRDCESTVLGELDGRTAVVCATGGGIVVREENRRRMRALGRIIYLRTRWDTLQERLAQSTGRPLVDENRDWAAIQSLWLSRQEAYLDADLVVDTDGLSAELVARQVVSLLENGGKIT